MNKLSTAIATGLVKAAAKAESAAPELSSPMQDSLAKRLADLRDQYGHAMFDAALAQSKIAQERPKYFAKYCAVCGYQPLHAVACCPANGDEGMVDEKEAILIQEKRRAATSGAQS